MRIDTVGRASLLALLALLVMAGPFSRTALAAPPVVKTVPWVSSNPLIPHDTFAGKSIMLKGTSDVQGANIQYTWDFGDGSPVVTGTVSNMYVIEAAHVYNGPVGTIWTARLTVQNTSTGETGSKPYYVEMRAKNLSSEVNVAIDEGLWYLHKTQYRYSSGGVLYGYWRWYYDTGGYGGNGRSSNAAANLNAFEVNGHLESGNPDNPYTETAARAMHWVLINISSTATSIQFNPLAPGGFNPDANGNGLYLWIDSGSYQFYETGPVMDAIVASGTPTAIAPVGGANVAGRTYRDIVQDMVDAHSQCQYDTSPVGGGWYYTCNGYGDNSISQWAAIGILAANRVWGRVVPQVVKDYNLVWLNYSQNAAGEFGYQSSGTVWGPYATTPSGMVQLAMDGVGRGNTRWDRAETYLRDRFGNIGGYGNAIRDYYYGLFSFVKAMLLHDSNADGVAEPIQLLRSLTPNVQPIDWYAAQAPPNGTDAFDGVARTLVNDQSGAGYWWGHNAHSDQYPYETAWAIMMLSRTLFEAGAPVAVAEATPNPGVAGQVIQVNGGNSFHQDPTRNIVQWEWDFGNDGSFEAVGVTATRSYPAVGDYPVALRVTDNNVPVKTSTTVLTVRITTPPVAPTAQAGGPYNFCLGTPMFLDATGSTNPDQGQHQPGAYPPDTITAYEWDLDGNGQFGDASGAQPNVTAYFTAAGVGSRNINLRVTDNTAASFPSSGMGNLSDTDVAQVTIRAATDPACACVSNLVARPKPTKADLTWSWAAGVHHYNVYRGTISGGPYLKIGVVGSPGLPNTGVYADFGLTNGTTYYYVVRAALASDLETCQSNQASARPVAR